MSTKTVLPGETPERLRPSAGRGEGARGRCSERRGGAVLGADTVVVVDGTILGKPADDDDARADAAAAVGAHARGADRGVPLA